MFDRNVLYKARQSSCFFSPHFINKKIIYFGNPFSRHNQIILFIYIFFIYFLLVYFFGIGEIIKCIRNFFFNQHIIYNFFFYHFNFKIINSLNRINTCIYIRKDLFKILLMSIFKMIFNNFLQQFSIFLNLFFLP